MNKKRKKKATRKFIPYQSQRWELEQSLLKNPSLSREKIDEVLKIWDSVLDPPAIKPEATNNTETTLQFENFTPLSKRKVLSFLNERIKMYDSAMEAYVDGFLDGWNEKR